MTQLFELRATEHKEEAGMPVTFLDHKCIKIDPKRFKGSTIPINNGASDATEDGSCGCQNSVYDYEEGSSLFDSKSERERDLKNENSSGKEKK